MGLIIFSSGQASMNNVIENTLAAALMGSGLGSWVGIYQVAKEKLVLSPWKGFLLGAAIFAAGGAAYRILANLVVHPRLDEQFFVEYADKPEILMLSVLFASDITALRFAVVGTIGGGLLAWVGQKRKERFQTEGISLAPPAFWLSIQHLGTFMQ
jgi:hypothetical protein